MEFGQKRVILLTGDYGCGKTNLAVNLALLLARKGKVSVVDMDTVNPYFRSADFGEMFSKCGIKAVFPQYANTNLDIPVLNFDLESIISQSDFTIAISTIPVNLSFPPEIVPGVIFKKS